MFEPMKLQLKLEMTKLTGLLWDDLVPDQDQEKWRDLLAGFVDFGKMSVNRCIIPADIDSTSKIRLICLSDAALMISLDLEVTQYFQHRGSQDCYRFKKMRIQTELLDLLRNLPVCVGLGVKGDVHEIEQFYSFRD